MANISHSWLQLILVTEGCVAGWVGGPALTEAQTGQGKRLGLRPPPR